MHLSNKTNALVVGCHAISAFAGSIALWYFVKRAKQCLGTYSNESILNKKFVLFSELKITSRLYMLYAFLSFNRVLYLPVVSNHGFLVVDPARLHNSNGCIGRIPLHENRNARNSPHRLVGKTQCLKSSARQKKDIKCLIHFSSPVQTAILLPSVEILDFFILECYVYVFFEVVFGLNRR